MKQNPLIISALIVLLLCFAALVTLAQEGDEPAPAAIEDQHMTSDAILANIGTGFTYQGYLEQSGVPVDDTCDFLFKLYDADYPDGTLLGGFEAEDDTPVTEGYFTVLLNESEILGADVFNGEARWLQIHVRCPGGGGNWDLLLPRQQLTASPYALALPGLWTQQNGTSPNLIGGFGSNVMGNGVAGGVIAGGGTAGFANQVFDNYGTVSGGRSNVAGSSDGDTTNQDFATVSGGNGNTANGRYAVVGGGFSNSSSGSSATVSGGLGNNAATHYTTVSGGWNNTASAAYATVNGGGGNTASGGSATVSGGFDNLASGNGASIGGGANNLASAKYATIAGGGPSDAGNPTTTSNRVYDEFGTIGGGSSNVAGIDDGITNNQNAATVSGGGKNTASNVWSTVGGGGWNTASGAWATVGGGFNNEASAQYATVAGGQDALASQYNQQAFASGRFAENGDAQTSLYVLRQETSDVALTELFLDGSSERITLAADRVLTFDILVVGTHRFGGGSSAGYQVTGVIKNIGGTTSFVGTPVVDTLAEDVSGWDVQVTADNTLDALVIKVQGSSGTSIRWVASARTVEVGR